MGDLPSSEVVNRISNIFLINFYLISNSEMLLSLKIEVPSLEEIYTRYFKQEVSHAVAV